MHTNNVRRPFGTILSILVLLISYLLFGVALFDLHGMKDFPLYLLIVGVLVIVLSSFADLTITKWGVSLGYVAGVCLGFLFHKEWEDIHGTRIDNFWQWMMLTMLMIICLSLIVDMRKKGTVLCPNKEPQGNNVTKER